MAGPKHTHLFALGLFVAALGLVFIIDALRWLLPLFAPGSAGIGSVAGGFTPELASALVLLLVGACLALSAALRRGRLK